MSQVAVVILNYNGKELLKKFLPAVTTYSPGARVIVADNHSSDGSVEFLQKTYPEIETIQIHDNLGFCGGYNFALKQIQSEYYVLLNSDVEVTQGWLTPIVKLMEEDSSVGAVQPKILSYNQRDKFEYAGAAGGFIDWLGFPFCRGRIFETVEEDRQQYNDTLSIFWATGACLAVRSSLFHSLGGLDEKFFAHMEEIDFCWRLHRFGYKVMYCGNSQVYHVGGATLSQRNPQKTYYNFRNGLQMLIKNLPRLQLMARLPVRVVLDWVASIKFLIEGQPNDFLAVARAHGYVMVRFVSLLKTRQKGSHAPMSIYKRSIVFDYFVLGKRKFGDLNFNSPK